MLVAAINILPSAKKLAVGLERMEGFPRPRKGAVTLSQCGTSFSHCRSLMTVLGAH